MWVGRCSRKSLRKFPQISPNSKTPTCRWEESRVNRIISVKPPKNTSLTDWKQKQKPQVAGETRPRLPADAPPETAVAGLCGVSPCRDRRQLWARNPAPSCHRPGTSVGNKEESKTRSEPRKTEVGPSRLLTVRDRPETERTKKELGNAGRRQKDTSGKGLGRSSPRALSIMLDRRGKSVFGGAPGSRSEPVLAGRAPQPRLMLEEAVRVSVGN